MVRTEQVHGTCLHLLVWGKVSNFGSLQVWYGAKHGGTRSARSVQWSTILYRGGIYKKRKCCCVSLCSNIQLPSNSVLYHELASHNLGCGYPLQCAYPSVQLRLTHLTAANTP
jgi:hypothetical protein